MSQHTTSAASTDLNWLIADLVDKTGAQHAVLLSADGLTKAYSGIGQDDAEALAALASGLQSMARSAGDRSGAGAVQQTLIEWENAYLLVVAAGAEARLAVHCAKANADISVVAYEVNTIIGQVARHLKTPPRSHPADRTTTS